MKETIAITLTIAQAKAVRNAIFMYENDSGKDDVDLACEILSQFGEIE